METLEAITTRRSVKHYDPAHRLSEAEIEKLIGLAMLSPTSFNIQNWRFVVVADAAERKALREAAWNQAQVTDASALFILCADLRAWAREPQRYWRDAPAAARDALVPMIGQFYEGRDQLQRDEAMRSCGIAAQTIMLAARALGYDSCPMIGFDPEKTAAIINLPEDHVIGLMITVGKALQPAWDRPGQLPPAEVLVRDRF
ncbi:MAG: nitroreductase family protein [Planctomycetes bacterium]|nr:nitroreductase family protein [Planctomycetota bacterium]